MTAQDEITELRDALEYCSFETLDEIIVGDAAQNWLRILEMVEAGEVAVVPCEPLLDLTDAALHEIGTPNPKESKQWCREYYKAAIKAAPDMLEKIRSNGRNQLSGNPG